MTGGAVRLYPLDADGLRWQGDRLAVLAGPPAPRPRRARSCGSPCAPPASSGGERDGRPHPAGRTSASSSGWAGGGRREQEIYVGVEHQPMAIALQPRCPAESGGARPVTPSTRRSTTVSACVAVAQGQHARGVDGAQRGVGQAPRSAAAGGRLALGSGGPHTRKTKHGKHTSHDSRSTPSGTGTSSTAIGDPAGGRLEQHGQRAEQAGHADVLGGRARCRPRPARRAAARRRPAGRPARRRTGRTGSRTASCLRGSRRSAETLARARRRRRQRRTRAAAEGERRQRDAIGADRQVAADDRDVVQRRRRSACRRAPSRHGRPRRRPACRRSPAGRRPWRPRR